MHPTAIPHFLAIFFSTVLAVFPHLAPAVDIRVNAGGAAYTDGGGNVWSADTGFNTGLVSSLGSGVDILGTSDDPLYQLERFDIGLAPELLYSFAVPNGDYAVNLHMAENWSGAFGVGLRVFDVQMEGALVLNDVDIFAEAGGGNRALVRSVPLVTVSDGQLDIEFIHQVQNPMIGAIEIIALGTGTPDVDPPTVPQSVSAAAVGANQVDVSWDAATDVGGGVVAGYNVYRADTGLVGTVAGTGFSDTTVVAASSYDYTVTAFDNASPANESAPSSPPASVTTPAPDVDPPTVPQNVSATAVDANQVDVSWDAATDVGGGAVAGYNVYRADAGLVGTVTGTSFSDTTVVAASSYDYTVTAFDNASPANESAPSSPPASVTTPDAPAVTIRVNAGGAAYTDGGGNVWSADTGFNTGLVSSLGSGVDILGTSDDPLYQLERFDVGLAPELLYSFAVPNGDYAVNLHMAENWSGAFGVGLRVFDVQMEGALVLNDVDIFAEAGGGNRALVRSVPLVTVSDGQLDIEFIHQVQNPMIGAIEIIALGAGTPDVDPPTVPQSVSAAAVGANQVDVSWDAATDVGGGVVAGYNVYRADTGLVGTVAGTGFSDTTVVAASSYDYTVTAFDNASPANESAPSSPPASVTTPAPDVDPPTVPQNVGATAVDANQVDVSWDAATDVGGGAVAGYNVYRADAGLVGTVTGTSFSDTTVVAASSYDYTVTAFDNASPANESAPSSPPASVTTPDAPAVTIRVNAGGAAYTDGGGNVWSADTGFNTGLVSSLGSGVDILGTSDDPLYQLERFDIGLAPELLYSFAVPNGDYAVNLHMAENWSGAFGVGLRVFDVQMEGALVLNDVDIFAEAGGGNRALVRSVPLVTVSDGQLDIEFIHQVQNPMIGAIEIIALGTGTPDVDPPTVPQSVSAAAVGANQVDVSWDAATDVGGGVVAGYNVYRADTGLVGTVAGTGFSDTTVVAASSYDYTVTAFDNASPANESAPSSPPASVTTPAPDVDPPTVPQNVGATAVDANQVDVSWDAATDVGGGAVAGYNVYRADAGLVGTVTGTSFSDTTVVAASSYDYTVTAFDNASPANESAPSSPPASVTTPDAPDVDPPTVPQNVGAAAVGSNRVDVSWDAATDVGGGAVAGYNVYRADAGLVGTVTGTSFSDTTVVAASSYDYTVTAFDNASPANESAPSSPPASVTTPDASGGVALRINAGGPQYTDGAGNTWAADTGFNTGLVSTAGNGVNIIGTADDPIYQVQRFDDVTAPELTYSFALPDGDYTVNLHFAENYGGVFASGARVFSVAMEGATVISSLDVFDTVGANTVLVRSVPVTVSDGQLDIDFLREFQNPIVAGIEIISTGSILPVSYNFNVPDVSDWMPVSETGIAHSWQPNAGSYEQATDVADQQFGNPFDQSYKLGTFTYLPALMSLSDYSFSADITPLRDLPARDLFDGQDVGVMFRYQDNDNYYRLSFSTRESFARLEKKVGGVFTTLATNARGYLEEQTFTVSVNVSGDLIQVTRDGDPVFAVRDTDLSSGSVALYCQDAAAFDNVVVDIPDPNPTLVLSGPLAHSVQPGTAVTGSAAVTNMPPGGSVEFEFGGMPCAAATESPAGSGFYTADCGNAAQGDYFIAGQGLRGLLRNNSGGVVASDENLRVGIQGDQYVAVGDSITLGTYDLFSADNQSADGRVIGQQGYQAELSELLSVSTGYPNMVFNDGIGGDTTATTLTRIDSILERHPDSNHVLMMLGTNDAFGGTPISDTIYQANMQSLVDTMSGQGNTVWVAKAPPALPSASNTTHNSQVRLYNTAIDSLSGIQSGPDFYAFYFDDNDTPADSSDDYERLSLYYNALHPNALGIRIMSYLWHNARTGGSTLPLFLDRLCSRLVSADCLALSPTNHKQNLLETGYPQYVDESYTLSTIPPALAEGVWIQTANAESGNSASDYIDFIVDRPVTVYVAYDAGASSLPGWLDPASSGYVDAGMDIQTTDPLSPTLHVYSQNFPVGSVSLGGNLASGASDANSNYVVIVVAQ